MRERPKFPRLKNAAETNYFWNFRKSAKYSDFVKKHYFFDLWSHLRCIPLFLEISEIGEIFVFCKKRTFLWFIMSSEHHLNIMGHFGNRRNIGIWQKNTIFCDLWSHLLLWKWIKNCWNVFDSAKKSKDSMIIIM